MKKIIAFLFAFIAVFSSAEIRKSSQAAFSISKQQDATFENPYITDGLVAMWDGIVSPGKNLIADYGHFQLQDSAVSNGSIHITRYVDAELPYNFCWLYDVGSIFVTCKVYNPSHHRFSIFLFPNISSTAASVGAYSFDSSVPIRLLRSVQWETIVNASSWPLDDIFTASYGIVFSTKKGSDNPNNVFCAYLDDFKKTEVRGNSWIFGYNFGMSTDVSQLRLGSQDGCDIEFYNIRLYNRELSQEEISYNYQIDKERFGI